MVLGAWAVTLGLLLKREYRKPRAARLAEAALAVPPGADFYAVYMGSSPIGYASSTVDTTPTGVSVSDLMVVDIEALGSVRRTQLRSEISLARDLRLLSFDATLTSEGTLFRATGRVEGDSVLLVEVDAGGQRPQRSRLSLERPPVLPAFLPLQLAFGRRLQAGRSYAMRVFDPLALQDREVTVNVRAESTLVVPDSASFDSVAGRWVPARADTVHAWKISQDYGGIGLESWIDDQGRVVSAVSPIGFRMERMAFELAVENWRKGVGSATGGAAAGIGGAPGGRRAAGGGIGDVIETTAIAAGAALEPEELGELRVRLLNVSLGGFDLSGGRQRLEGDTLTVRREAGPLLEATYRLPFPLPRFRAELSPELLVQSDDPRIQAQARRIVGGTHSPRRAAELLTRWVHDHLDKQITVSVPSAVQVLEDRRGDCNEHTVLFVALARAVGLPARTAAGVVYLRGRFFYHAWPEVYLGDWVAVDPTFGQFPADAAHLRFVIGGLARQVELVRLIGRLDLEVVRPAG